MSEELGRCQYSVDVTEWYDARRESLTERAIDIDLEERSLWKFADGFLNEDDEWQCYRRTRPGDSHCLFHAHASDEEIESLDSPGQVFRDIVTGETETPQWNEGYDGLWEVPRYPPERETPFTRDEFKHRERQFIGARLGEVELSYENLDGPESYPIDLRVARAESLDLYGTQIGAVLDLRGFTQTSETVDQSAYRDERNTDEEYGIDLKKAQIDGGLVLNDADLAAGIRLREMTASYVRFDRATVDGEVTANYLESGTTSFKRARIHGSIVASDATSSESIRLRGASIDHDVSLKRATVNQKVIMSKMTAGRDVALQDIETRQTVFAEQARIGGQVSLNRAVIGRSVLLNESKIEAVSVSYAELDGSLKLNQVTASDYITVENTSIEERILATGLTTGGRVSLENTTVEKLVDFQEVAISGNVKFDQADLSAVRLYGERIKGDLSFDLTEVELGVIIHVSEVYEDISFTNALLGDELYIEYSNVGGSVVLHSTSVDGSRAKTALVALNVGERVDIRECQFASDLEFNSVAAHGTLSVTESTVNGELWLSKSTATFGRLDLSETTAAEFTLRCGLKHPAVSVVTLERTAFETATLQARNGNDDTTVVYDLREATVGEFTLQDEPQDNDADTRAFEQLRFLKTTFDGFVFSERRGQFGRTDWQAHRPRDGGYEDIAIVTQRCSGPVQSADESDKEGGSEPWGCVFDVSRDIVDAAGYTAVRRALEDSSPTGSVDETASSDTDQIDNTNDVTLDTADTDAVYPTVRAYLNGAVTSATAPVQVGNDPFSALIERLGLQWTPSATRDRSEPWETVAESRLDDLSAAVHEHVDPIRTRRALELPYSAATRARNIDLTLQKMFSNRLPDGESAPTGSLPSTVDSNPGGPLTAPRLARAVFVTFTYPDVFKSILATIENHETNGTSQSASTAVDGGIPLPVDIICRSWEIETGPNATAFETAVREALTEAAYTIIDAAAVINDDRERLAAAGLGAEAVTGDETDAGTPYAESAILDAALSNERSGMVATAEFVADSLQRAEADETDDDDDGDDDDDDRTVPQFRRIADRLDIDPTTVAQAETAIARDLADYRTAKGKLEELESTYALAKNGASEAGDETAAGNFFQRQAGYARRQHWQQLTSADASVDEEESTSVDVSTDEDGPTSDDGHSRGLLQTLLGLILVGSVGVYGITSGALVALVETVLTAGLSGLISNSTLSGQLLAGVVLVAVSFALLSRRVLGQLGTWIGNVFLWLTMGYGEQPTRVLGFSAVIIGVSAVLYDLLSASIDPVFGSAFLGRLVFSFDVFVTLALGEPPGVDELVRLLAVVEGFAGVFVIGMFVVTVTRAVHR